MSIPLAVLHAVADRIVPADETPGAVALGAADVVHAQIERADVDAIGPGLRALDKAALAFGADFAALSDAQKDGLLARHAAQPWFQALTERVTEAVYADPGNGGNDGAATWRMIGYEPRLPDPLPRPASQGTVGLAEVEGAYDAIVVGAGAGGGVVACLLAEAGRRVLLLDRGPDDGAARAMPRDHLRNQRLSTHGHNAGPDVHGNPRVLVDIDNRTHTLAPHEAGYQNNANAIGGGTLVYGAQAWRYHPDDFRMASVYGVPDGSSLADWPIGYDDLEPSYERAEWEVGVAGAASGHPGRRARGYPMPPMQPHASAAVLGRGAQRLGLATLTPPLLINTVPRDGRPACVACGSCVGFACPVDAKNGTQNTMIARALATGRCTLATSVLVSRIDTEAAGHVTGATCRDTTRPDLKPRSVGARVVVVAAGAIETARLLLLSACEQAPNGLGNGADLVGRNLQGHASPTVYGRFTEPVYDPRGPGVSIATCAFSHGNPGVIGGAMIADDFIMLPAIFSKKAMPPRVPRWGGAAKRFMRDEYRYVSRLYGPVQEIPSPYSRVTLDPEVRDGWGLPVARLSGHVHPETMRTAAFIRDRAHEWLVASGAVETWGDPLVTRLSAGQHQAGTCRMGNDPATSVTDATGRVWGHDNLFVADGSLHPTNGGFNPVLTILATAFRNAEAILARL